MVVFKMSDYKIFIGTLFKNTIDTPNYSIQIKKYMKPEDYEWANTFCHSIFERKDYLKNKEFLLKINIDVLSIFHEHIQSFLNNNNPSTQSLQTYFNDIATLHSLATQIATRIMVEQIVLMSEKASIEDMQAQYFSAMASTKQDNSDIVLKARQSYIDECFKRYGIKLSYLKPLIKQELNNIPNYLLHSCKVVFKAHLKKVSHDRESEYTGYQRNFLSYAAKMKSQGKAICRSHRINNHISKIKS